MVSTVFLRSQIPAQHPSASLLGEERLGAGVAIAPDRVLTAHYLVMGASEVCLSGVDGRSREVRRVSLDHETGLALLSLEGEPLTPARIGASAEVVPGLPIFMTCCCRSRASPSRRCASCTARSGASSPATRSASRSCATPRSGSSRSDRDVFFR